MTRVLYVGNGFCSARSLAGDLPKHLLEAGVQTDVIVPRSSMHETGSLAERLVTLKAEVGGDRYAMKLYEGRQEGNIRVFYVDNCTLLGVFPNLSKEDGIRAASAFAQAVTDWAVKAPFQYDIIHTDGLEAGLAAVYMRTVCAQNSRMKSAKIVSFVKGIEDKGTISMDWLSRFGLPENLRSSDGLEFYGQMSLLKGIYQFADAVVFPNADIKSQISKQRGQNIGIEGVLLNKLDRVFSIQAGLNADDPSPADGRNIEAAYSASDLSGKAKCKAAFVQKYRLRKDRPLLAFIGRLDSMSGIDLVNDILDDLMDRQVNLIIAGDGNETYRKAIEGWKDEFRGSIALVPGRPDKAVRSRVMSAADIVLIPAKQESVSRQHLSAMRYACVPVVRWQGTCVNDIKRVRDIESIEDNSNGFAFDAYDGDDFFNAVMDAIDVYGSDDFAKIRANAAAYALSLAQTAQDCIAIYDALNT